MKAYVQYEDTDNTYDISLSKLLKRLNIPTETFEKEILNLLNES